MTIPNCTDQRLTGSTPSVPNIAATARYHQSVTTPHPGDDQHPTAGPLNLIQSFADTARQDADLLGDRDGAAAWLRTARLLPADASLSGSEHHALLRLRDALRDVMTARADARPDADAASRLTRALADGRLVVTLDPAGTSGLASSARASYSSLVAALAIAITIAFRQ